MLQNFRPPYDATVYSRLRSRGALLVGKTNLDQFGMGSGTIDSCFGPTRNVWKSNQQQTDDWHISGGSSGGSAVAVASGICYASLGSDTGGSTRNPASYCGVVGLKPTYGLVSRYGLIPLVNSMDVPGIMTRTVDDCATVLSAIAGPDPMDATTLKQSHRLETLLDINDISMNGIRVGIPKEYHCEGLSDECLETWSKVADILETGGACVDAISLPHTDASIFVYTILNQCEVASNMSRYDGIEYGLRADEMTSSEELYAKSRAEGFNSVVKNRILSGNFYLLRRNYEKYFEKALSVRRLIANDFRRVFADCDVILTPTTLSDAPTYREFTQHSNRDQCARQDFCTQPANMAGIPAITIPIRLSSKGMPLSVQLMGDRCAEQKLLTVAKWIEHQVQFRRYQKSIKVNY